MRSTFAALAATMVLFAGVQDSRAQEEPAPQDPGQARSEQCLRLEAQLAALGRGPSRPNPRQLEQAVAKQQSELDRTTAYARSLSCGRRFLFAPEPPAECGPLESRIRQMQVNLDRLRVQATQAGQSGGGDPRRRELLIALARGQCGPQYRLVERRITREAPQERKGFFATLFGGGQSEQTTEETVIEPEMDESGGAPRVSTYRTVCVRTCDGFFFPISYQTTRNAFQRDDAICQATCPGTEAKLFAYGNPGSKIEFATAIDGQPYAKLENAFRYRKEFVAGCSCKPDGMSWAEALKGVDDKTVKKGDIVVDEETSEALSRAKSPEEQAKAQAQAQAQARSRPEAPRRRSEPQETGAPADPSVSPFGQPTDPGGRDSPSDDVIILDQPRLERGAVERRPLDGPSMQRIPD
ncbi:DUF2865 domain-containing protein [Hansschlegelia sp. KR7-227]|uniref:DUF2865 domain-containing protein n=1 Tax=Hansschlegelia sp. KR7-227 TaxID=3400914 RepID=UPI003C08BF2A